MPVKVKLHWKRLFSQWWKFRKKGKETLRMRLIPTMLHRTIIRQ
jgi:hypothetical protein